MVSKTAYGVVPREFLQKSAEAEGRNFKDNARPFRPLADPDGCRPSRIRGRVPAGSTAVDRFAELAGAFEGDHLALPEQQI